MVNEELKTKIAALYSQRPEFVDFFRVLGSRQRNSSFTELERFCKSEELLNLGHENERKRLAIDFFKELQSLGVGTFRVGRRKKPTRFIWSAPMLEVAQAAQFNETAEIDREAPRATAEQFGESRKVITHKYVLREDFIVTFDLPINLSGDEADRLSDMIKTLPLNRSKKGEE